MEKYERPQRKITMKEHLLMEFVLKEKSTAKPSLVRQENDLICRYKWFGELSNIVSA